MNTFSDEAEIRTQLFVSLATKDGLTVLPGRYGGEYNNDMLAVKDIDGKTLLVLGLKVSDDEGNQQLDMQSMGAHRQFSPEWLDTIIYSLGLLQEGKPHANKIAAAKEAGRLKMGLVCLDRTDEQVSILAINGEVDET